MMYVDPDPSFAITNPGSSGLFIMLCIVGVISIVRYFILPYYHNRQKKTHREREDGRAE